MLYGAFDHGSVSVAAGARMEVAIAVVAAVAAAGLGLGGLGLRGVPRSASCGLALLAGFACWCGITLLWSVAPDQTWIELNRAVVYVLVAGLAIAIGASDRRAPTWLAVGFLLVTLIVATYALAQKLTPGLHVSGIFDLNQTGAIPRLQEPIGYWNALALFLVLGAPIALAFAVDSARSSRQRMLAAGVLELLLVTIGLTLSRGGLLALAVALIVTVAGSRARLRVLAWLGLVIIVAVPPLAVGLTMHSLTHAGVPLGRRETAGAILAAALVVTLALVAFGARGLAAYEPRLHLTPTQERWARRVGLGALAVLVCGGVAAAVLAHAWHHFTSPSAPSNVNPSRLLTTDSYRWLWWKEAARAFAGRPVGGWGAGSFGVLHLIYRQNTLPVDQPHSVPLQFLSETGVVGALLGLGGLALLLLAAVRSTRHDGRTGGERGLTLALLAGAAAYGVHSLYDWDWNLPALTLPALLFIGVLAGGAGERSVKDESLGGSPNIGVRAISVILATLWLSLFAVSALLPSLAASRADTALIQASSSSAAALRSAQSEARLASSLDPFSDTGLRAEASIALHRGALGWARYDLEQALGRDPSDELAWNELAQLDLLLGDRVGGRLAARRVVELDPRGPAAQALKHARLAPSGF